VNCEELRPDYLLYALGVLEDPERTEVRAHLDRGCADCTAGVREARSWAYAMGASVEGPAPPRRLRRRVLSIAAAAPKTERNWFAGWIAAVATALAGIVVVMVETRSFRAEEAGMRAEIARSGMEATALRQAFDFIQAPDTREVNFGQGEPAPPRGRVFVSRSGVLLIASRLPAPPPGKTYEMWIIRGGSPRAAGLFASDAQGNALHFYRPEAAPASGDTVAVTMEPAPGVNAPTSAPVIAVGL
jgi:anti-sigma-K factor RskA